MDLVLSGRTISPATANKLGIVDFSVPQRQLESTARFVLERKPPRRKAGFMLRLLNYSPARTVISLVLRRRLEKKISRSHYPAPFSVIDFWQEHGGNRNAMFAAEQESISRLFTTDTSRNLVRVFFLQEALKSRGKRGGPVFSHVHVIGAGTMGGDIASWCAMAGLRVTIHDRDPDALARATQRAYQLFRSRLKSKRLAERAMDRFIQDTRGSAAAGADIIIEAIVEDADIKQAVFRELEKIARPDAILATNTSSISLETIARKLKKPGRLVGLHFFNPVAKMQLIEVVYGHKTYKKYRQSAAAFCSQIGRLPVAVKSSPGFLVNRVLMPYTLEAVAILNDGVAAVDIDLAATSFGMPMGPLALADTVGLDICLDVAENLADTFHFEVPDLLREHVRKGRLGKKSGKGFYSWKNGKPVTAKPGQKTEYDSKDNKVQQRLIFRYLNECVACLDEKLVGNQDDLDAALVFATGFAPFRGGPVNYLLSQGVEQKLQTLQGLQQEFGERFTPHPGWQNLANPGIN
jgi:3-hydroxyacyl-CoA dehydrogenase/enoyl-CoA hydratase/3-hydroxybutyryl-CoA epimerase